MYDSELQIILDWLNQSPAAAPTPSRREARNNKEREKEREQAKANAYKRTDIPKHVIAQVLVDVLKRPDIPPFTLTPSQICAGRFSSYSLL